MLLSLLTVNCKTTLLCCNINLMLHIACSLLAVLHSHPLVHLAASELLVDLATLSDASFVQQQCSSIMLLAAIAAAAQSWQDVAANGDSKICAERMLGVCVRMIQVQPWGLLMHKVLVLPDSFWDNGCVGAACTAANTWQYRCLHPC